MHRHTGISQLRAMALLGALILVLTSGALVTAPRRVVAAVVLEYFRAIPGDNSILLEWKTATEVDTAAFNLYRSQDSGSQGQQIGATFPAEGDGITGALYSYRDTDVVPGQLYYYSLAEIDLSGGLTIIARANAGIGMPTLTPTPTATATATATATTVQSGVTATRTATVTATSVPGEASGGQPTATRRFTNTPRPTAAATPGSAANQPSAAPTTPAPAGSGLVSTPTGLPQQPPAATSIRLAASPMPAATPRSPAPAIPSASPSPAIVTTSEVQPMLEFTPAATRSPQVFAAATSQPLLGTPGRAVGPTPAPTREGPRGTGTILLLGGGAILLAALLGGGVLLLLRSRQK